MEAAISYTAGVFISYRRRDTAFPAGWLFNRLVEHFGREHIFKDVDSIQPGEDFVEVITYAVMACHTMLVIIGPNWLTSADDPVSKRDVGDFVQLEVATALAHRLQVIPILVGDAPRRQHASCRNRLRPWRGATRSS